MIDDRPSSRPATRHRARSAGARPAERRRRRRPRGRRRAQPAAAAAAVGPAAAPLRADRGRLRRRARVDPRRLAARARGDRDGLPRRRRPRAPARRRRRRPRRARERVRFDRGMVLERITDGARRRSRCTRRTPTHDLEIGGDWIAFGSVASAPNVADLDRGRRVGNRADYQDLIRLSQMLNVVHFFAGYPVEPIDIHPSIRHLDAIHDLLTLADKPIHAYSLGRQRNTRRDRDGPDRARHRRRDPRARAVGLHGHQLELAAPARHADAPRHPRDVGAQPGHRHDPVHARRGDGAR